jgi:hypothetical protein
VCEVKTKGFIKLLALGWIGGRKDGHKGGVKGPCEVWVDR